MADYVDKGLEKMGLSLSKPMLAVICLIFGIVVIVLPNLLVWIVGLFLIVQGILLLTDLLEAGTTGASRKAPMGVYCTHCGTGNIAEAAYCKRCGKELGQPRKQEAPSKSKSPQK